MSRGLYGVTVWPPAELADFIREFQARHRVASYGQPHFNLRYPFLWPGTEEELVASVERAAAGIRPFRATIDGWHEFPNALYLGVRATPSVLNAHARLFAVGGAPLTAGMDDDAYVPHISVALGLLDAARQEVVEAARALTPPVRGWRVTRVVVTRDDSGELLEVASVPLGGRAARAKVGKT